MKQWFAEHILANNVKMRITMPSPISEKEFYFSLTMVCTALALFGILVNILGK